MLWWRCYRKKVCDLGSGSTIDERRRKRGFILARIVAERSVSDFVEVGGPFERGIEHAPANANAGRAGLTENLAKGSVMGPKGIGQSQARSKVVPARGRQRTRDTGITREHPADWGTWEDHGLFAGNEGLDFVVLFMPGRADVVAQTIVERQVWFHAPTVLRIKTKVEIPSVRRIGLALDIGGRSSQKKINKIAPGFAGLTAAKIAAVEKIAVSDVRKIFFQLVVVVLASE